MEVIVVLVGLILLIFILGMLFRKRGDNAIDTMGAGCKSIFLIGILIAVAVGVLIYSGMLK